MKFMKSPYFHIMFILFSYFLCNLGPKARARAQKIGAQTTPPLGADFLGTGPGLWTYIAQTYENHMEKIKNSVMLCIS